MGARKVVVASLGPLGCIPFQLTFRLSRHGECSDKVNAEVRDFNAGLFAMVEQLNAELPGAKFIYADAYKGVLEMIQNPSAYGKADASFVHIWCWIFAHLNSIWGFRRVTIHRWNILTGFKVVDEGCCGAGGTYKGVIPCSSLFKLCPNRFDHLFWDPYHPTDKANVALSAKFWSGTGYTWPVNVQQLLMSWTPPSMPARKSDYCNNRIFHWRTHVVPEGKIDQNSQQFMVDIDEFAEKSVFLVVELLRVKRGYTSLLRWSEENM